ncbi:MAG: hypothetical protein JNJ63_05175 [Hyphomonadaceae bacterium]|nr:hypothetical protein [Hyphomonadaceae bacterium]
MSAAILVLALLGGCTTSPPAAAPQTPDEATAQDSCGAARFRHLMGAPADQIDRAALPPRTRIITPGMMVTQDFSPQRLNIFVGVDGKVGSLRCF